MPMHALEADGLDEPEEPGRRPHQLTAALNRAPWWVTLIVYFGLPSSMGFLAFLVFLGMVPSPYMLEKFQTIHADIQSNRAYMETLIHNQDRLIAEQMASNHNTSEQLRMLRTCMKHPEFKSCEDW